MSWTRQRVLVLAGVIFVAHLIVLSACHTPDLMVVLPDGFRSPRRVNASTSTNSVIELDGLNDPIVFAGAHQHGFSAFAWMMRPRNDYELTNSPPVPRFLAFARSSTELPAAPRADVEPQSALPFISFNLPKEPPRSILRVEGGLENRPLIKAPALAIQIGSDVLTNSVIQVGVRADGFPFSARIISGSGSRLADLTALDLAYKARFAALPPSASRDPVELQWGELVFQWFTADAAATNNVPRTSVSAAK
jgi:hypothetical protein